MTTVKDIYAGAERLINQIIQQEMRDQGHTLTGTMESSLTTNNKSDSKSDTLEGFAIQYTQYVNDGVPAESASMKQFPFLVNYFKLRGYPEESSDGSVTAKELAAATIHKWMKEGMSTAASKRFSKTGSRQNFVQNAFAGSENILDEYMSNSFDFAVNELYLKEKSETI